MHQEPVADEALVDEDVDGIAIELLQLGLGEEAGEAERAGIADGLVGVLLPGRRFGQAGAVEGRFSGDGQQLAEGVFAKDLVDALGGARDRRRGEDGVGGREQLEVLFRVDERVVRDERGDMGELSGLGAEEFAACRRVEEEIGDGDGGSARQGNVVDVMDFAAGNFDVGPVGSSPVAVSRVTRATEAMEGRASPRKPRVAMVSRSSAVRSLEVAWRSKASRASSRLMPWPSSAMRMSLRPPASTSTRMRVAPASRAFSSSSFTTEAGRSTTSPAAIWLAT